MGETEEAETAAATTNGNSTETMLSKLVSELNFSAESSVLEEAVEKKGCQEILQALSAEELSQLPDANMTLRHLRAEKGNVVKATTKVKATLAWRQEFGVDKIRTAFEQGGDAEMAEIIAFENEPGKTYVRGHDKTGTRAVMYMKPARENSTNEEDNMRHLVYNMERAIACSTREKFIQVIDYHGFTLGNAPPLSTAKYTLRILQHHYPERLHRAFLCDPPFLFRTFWTVIRPFVDPVTKEKIVFLSGKAAREKMAQYFDLSQMEACAYGTADPPLREFDSQEYLRRTPLHKTFDEKDQKDDQDENEEQES